MALHWLCKDICVQFNLIVDARQDQTYIKYIYYVIKKELSSRSWKKGNPWASGVELSIDLLIQECSKYMHALHSPMVLLDYVIEICSLIHNKIPRPMFHNNGLNTHEVTLGAPVDIIILCVYGCYEQTYYQNHGAFYENKDKYGRVIGPIN